MRKNAEEMSANGELIDAGRKLVFDGARYKRSYMFEWAGAPIIQDPEDIVVTQEAIWRTRPTIIIETGVARGGSVLFLAAMMQMVGGGRVIGVDIDIRPHNRNTIKESPFSKYIHLIDGSSIAQSTFDKIKTQITNDDRVMVILDSNHTHDHVAAELKLYADLVTPECHLVVADTLVEHAPAALHADRPWGVGDNPMTAARAFLEKRPDFEIDAEICDKLLTSSNPSGYLIRRDAKV